MSNDQSASYPGEWRALRPGSFLIGSETHVIIVVECGELALPSGRLVAADPFVTLERVNAFYQVPPGQYPVRATIDETLQREMYVSLILSPAPEVRRQVMTPLQPEGESFPNVEGGAYGIPVDSGTVCFADDATIRRYMPEDVATWYESLFESERPNSWFSLMDDPNHIRDGLANIRLPLAPNGENIILAHSGWGDGFYPVVGGYDDADELVAVHIDLLLHGDDSDEA